MFCPGCEITDEDVAQGQMVVMTVNQRAKNKDHTSLVWFNYYRISPQFDLAALAVVTIDSGDAGIWQPECKWTFRSH